MRTIASMGHIDITKTETVLGMKQHLHSHPGTQFVYLQDFDGTLLTGASTSNVEQADMCMICADTPHRLISNQRHIIAININVANDYMQDLLFGIQRASSFYDRAEYLKFKLSTASGSSVVHMNRYERECVDRLTLGMFNEFIAGHDGSEYIINNMMGEFVVRLMRVIPSRNVERWATVQRVCAYLEEHIVDRFELDSVAAEFGFNKSHLCRIFREVQGQTMYEHLSALRVDRVMKRMRDTNLSITELSQEAGFTDYAQFLGCFRQRTGLTPAQWRRKQ